MIMKIEHFCFVVAALAALTGMCVSLFMGIAHDFTLAPMHTHLNLLGWVTMCLYGLYHRGRGRAPTRLSWIQVVARATGFICMSGGIGMLLASGIPATFPVTIGGAFLCILSMLLFLTIVATDAWHQSSFNGQVYQRGLQVAHRTYDDGQPNGEAQAAASSSRERM